MSLLRRLPEPAWRRSGRHTEFGAHGALDWLRIYAGHLERHARQIEDDVATWKRRAGAR